jgi:hypothetical protein
MGVPISNVTRRAVFAASGTGPYSFTFEILANTDIAVYKDDELLTLTTDYSVTINSNGTGSITLTASPTGADQIAIVGNRAIQRTTDFVTGGDFFANTVNDEMDQQTIFAQQNAEGLLRALTAPQTDPTDIDMTLPRASVRANKNLAFDADGNPVVGEAIGDYREDWESGTAYNKRDIVKDPDNANIYYCLTAHTSSGSAPISTNADSAKWSLIVDAEAAGDAQTAAEAAQAAAETAQAAAETAETNAETAETNAETAATNAASSASAASTSATNAATSASTASTKASDASTSATAAASSASSASSSASSASTSATNAASSASSASTSASNASTSATNAASSASSASTSASTATTQATNAASSASSASTSATNASNSATAAASSASAAATSETNAAASAASAASALDSFDDRYLGSKTSDPTVDNDGNALVTGALYYNSSTQVMKVYDGANWIAATAAGTTAMNVYKYVATAGQTDFSGAATVGGTMSYTSGNIIVFLNGAALDSTDYTATNGTSVVLGSAAALNDEVVIVAFKSFTVADTYTQSAADAKFVEATGAETIAGVKTFSNQPVFSAGIDLSSNGQIKFPASQNASSDANTLDDYEEGTWTPVITGSGSNPTVTYSLQSGNYVKVGSLVKASFSVYVNTTSGGSGYAIISLPFSNGGYSSHGAVRVENATGVSAFNMAVIEDLGATATCYIRINTNVTGNGADLQISNLQSGTRLVGTYMYRTA